MLAERPWLLVFDLDGTLIDSSLDLCLAVNAALQYVGAPVLAHTTISSFIGEGAAVLMQRALGAATIDANSAQELPASDARLKQALEYFLSYYSAHKLDNTRLHAGVLEALSHLRALDAVLLMAVLTNKPVRASREICEALRIAPFFFAIYGGNSFATKKPHPEGLLTLTAEARLRLSAPGQRANTLPDSGVVMIGDSATDVSTARHAGARSLGCLYGLAPESLQLTPPDMLCRSAAEWPALLGSERVQR